MATVVLAEDTLLGREVALKRMKVSDDARGLSRLRREALIGASVSHPNLVSIYDVVTSEDGDHVIVMEYVPGETLRDLLFRETRLAPGPALGILRGVSAALDAIHGQGIVHRDVKPANILLGSGDTVKLADLGIASATDRTRITTDGALLGTFSYMAPEQLGGSPATSAADIYALSAVAFEVLSGRKAHTEDNPVALAHAISTQPPPDLRAYWEEAPAAAAEVLIRGMSKDPDDRPRSASELTGRLNAALQPETTAPHASVPRPTRRRRGDRAREALAAGAAGAAAGAGEGIAEAANKAAVRPGTGPPVADPGPAHTRPEAVPARTSANRSRAGLVAAALISLVALAVVLTVILSSGGNPTRPRAANVNHAAKPAAAPARASSTAGSQTSTGTASATSTAAGSPSNPSAAPATGSSSGATGSPVSAVESFYQAAASHRYSQAWAMADPAFQSQLGGYQSFQSSQAGDRSITFNSAHVTNQSANAATVAVQTTSMRNDGTHQCTGTVDLARGGSSASWALHQIHINCT
jgi:eukaryotic-like serine/threonine-protein kinase